uniref:Uncharacterized protein n=1 Tax=Arundo donax TaxID=35708 RepID=A0A0A9C8U0_ARUDO
MSYKFGTTCQGRTKSPSFMRECWSRSNQCLQTVAISRNVMGISSQL